jgi:hypothetical protein
MSHEPRGPLWADAVETLAATKSKTAAMVRILHARKKSPVAHC